MAKIVTRWPAAALLAAGILAAAPAMAQQQRPANRAAPPPAPPAAAANPEGGPDRTSAQFGDWLVQCVTLSQGRRVCEMVQPYQDQRQQPVAVISVGRLSKDEPMKLSVRVPVNVQVTAPAQMTAEGGDSLTMPFQRCTIVPVGCFADTELRDDVLHRLRGRRADQAGRIAWRDANGGEVTIPVSFRGFTAAYEALLKEGG